MAMTAVHSARAFANKCIAVSMAVLLCMPMTGLEYLAYADEAASNAAAGQNQDAQPQENEAPTPPLFLGRRVFC